MFRRIAALTLVVAGSGLAVVGVSAPAEAAVTASTITSPANGTHYLITDTNAATTVNVTGTTNGTTGDTVDIRCYERATSWSTGRDNVAVAADGSFSTTMLSSVPYGTCTLRAVPSGLPSGSSLSAYAGPQLTREEITSSKVPSGPNIGKVTDFYVLLQDSRAMNDFVSATGGGYWDARLQYADGTASKYLWWSNAALGDDEEGARSFLQVDGHNAFGPDSARFLFTGSVDLAGLPALSYSLSRTATSATIHETEPLVVCSSDTFPPTAGSCTQFSSAGVQLERTLVITDGGRQVVVSDVWRSTDGRAHVLSPHYDQWLQAKNDTGTSTVGLKLPWFSANYLTYSSDVALPGTTNVPASIFVHGDNAAADGDTAVPRGALSLEHAPTSVFWTQNDEFIVRDENITVPAGGTKIVRQAFAMATTDAEVAAMAAVQRSRINQYRPDGLIKARHTAYLGDDVFNTTGADQTVTLRKKRGRTAVFSVKVTNDGTLTDTFKVKGTGDRTGFTVRYMVGKKDVTSEVVHGKYKIRNLAPGGSRVIRLVVKIKGGAHLGATRSWKVTSKSAHDTTSVDTVKARVRVSRR